MCSIFGFVARGSDRLSMDVLAAMVRANVQRGPHSFGLAWTDPAGRLHCFKQRGRMTDHLGILALVREARMVIGHLRFATRGDPADNINNHPHPADGGWVVHNGVVRNYEDLVRHRRLRTVSECDSEALGLMVESSPAPTLLGRCAESIDAAEGGLCMLGLWPRPASLVVARRGNPLHVTETMAGVYLATLRQGLPGRPGLIADGSIRLFRRAGNGITVRRQSLAAEPGTTVGAGALFDDDGAYAGG